MRFEYLKNWETLISISVTHRKCFWILGKNICDFFVKTKKKQTNIREFQLITRLFNLSEQKPLWQN